MGFEIYKWYTFGITFINYAAMYATRSAYSYNKQYFQDDMNVNDDFLGTLDMSFMLALAFSYIFLGDYAKKMDIKDFLLIGIIPSAISFLSFPILHFLEIRSATLLIISMVFIGIFQACVWPSVVSIMGNWFTKGHRGLLMGIWATNSNFGNILGMQICHMVIFNYQGLWTTCFIITGGIYLFLGIYDVLFLYQNPREAGFIGPQYNAQDDNYCLSPIESPMGRVLLVPLNSPKDKRRQQLKEDIKEQNQNVEEDVIIENDLLSQPQQQVPQLQIPPLYNKKSKRKPFDLNFMTAWSVPGVLVYSICYSCLKSTNYGLLLWLPKYLNAIDLNYYSASIFQVLQIGALFGGIIGGTISDQLGKRTLVLGPMIFIAALCMWLFRVQSGTEIWIYYVLIFIVGACLIGSDNIISSAISIDLGEQPILRGVKNANARISSLIEGLSAVAAAVTQKAIPWIGTTNLFFIFTAINIVGGIVIIPLMMEELANKKDKKQQ